MSTAPYSDAWRRATLDRIDRLGLVLEDVAARTGLDLDVLADLGPVSLETTGPIDELLDRAELAAEDAAAANFSIPLQSTVPEKCSLRVVPN